MDHTGTVPPIIGGGYAGGTIALHPDISSSPKLVSRHDASPTYFCITMFILLVLASLVFPRSVGASGLSYKLREFFLIFAFVSFVWTLFKQMKLWQYPFVAKVIVYIVSMCALVGVSGGLFVYHGVEERTNTKLQARPYMQTQNLMKK